ncbi:MAG TPA: WecB/TagA/CpsF family glycosyltransferase [Actinomycetota bacterium]|nr:WecB/TagA/CpsF family glycosyltransferase [Actinomycetota bacterium]
MNPVTPTVEILGVRFARVPPEIALEHIEDLYESHDPAIVAHANVHTVNLALADPGYMAALQRADLVLNDGKGVMLAARMYGRPFPADLNGNFFTPLLLRRAAERGWPTFFFGARPGVARRAADRLREELPALGIVGVRDGYARGEGCEVVDAIRASGAGLVLVGLGNPRQERWLVDNLAATGARLGVGVGAFFDFQAGNVPRAPAWMNQVGLEWLHRLTVEPRRMWRRYLVGNPRFLARATRERLSTGVRADGVHAE